MHARRPFIVGVGGFSSNVGKTTLMCELVRQLQGWEAIKTTKGHYRSCGKDPHACCVSHLLTDKPLVRSNYAETYEAGKDTGRYWDAGASNVHWVIATESQIGVGIKQALARVKSPGVLIEGNSFSQHVQVDFMLMVASGEGQAIKRSARDALSRCAALYSAEADDNKVQHILNLTNRLVSPVSLPVFTSKDLPKLVATLSDMSVHQAA
jgi:molybdopterin-guanine dinucleotide biosynthesis protein